MQVLDPETEVADLPAVAHGMSDEQQPLVHPRRGQVTESGALPSIAGSKLIDQVRQLHRPSSCSRSLAVADHCRKHREVEHPGVRLGLDIAGDEHVDESFVFVNVGG